MRNALRIGFCLWVMGTAAPSEARQVASDSVAVDVTASGAGSVGALDSTAVAAPDTPRTAESTSEPRRLISLLEPSVGANLSDRPGFFSRAFRESGWPQGVSPYGLDPDRLQIQLFGLPFESLLTGAPAMDLLPEAWISDISPATGNGLSNWAAELSRFDSGRPTTDIRYDTHGGGLQSVHALHVQNRRFVRRMDSVRTRTTHLQTAVGYHGAAANGDYPGSSLEAARRMTLRVRLERDGRFLELFELYNRRRIGAHGGVEPIPGAAYESIYQRLGATVTGEDDKRQVVRNDLFLRAGTLVGGRPAEATLFWTRENSHYFTPETSEGPSGTFGLLLERFGARATFDLGSIGLAIMGWRNRQPGRSDSNSGNSFLSLKANTSGSVASFKYDINGGVARDRDGSYPQLALSVERWGLAASSHYSGMSMSRLDHSAVQSNPGWNRYRIWSNKLRGVWEAGPFHIGSEAFHIRLQNALVHVQTADIHSQTISLEGTSTASGVSLFFTWSPRIRGPYLSLNPVLQSRSVSSQVIRPEGGLPQFPLGEASWQYSEQWVRSAPAVWANARAGWRALLFQGDLDLDLSVRARVWDAFGGRRLSTPTGLLILPQESTETVPSSGVVDVVAQARVRTATIYLSYENVMAGTRALAGNLLVPDYPLPAQRIRFGVFWPILD